MGRPTEHGSPATNAGWNRKNEGRHQKPDPERESHSPKNEMTENPEFRLDNQHREIVLANHT